jgi:cyclopropane-fatty-acyl-phospholipid synthase
MNLAIRLAENGMVPDAITRFGIKRLLLSRLANEQTRENGKDGIVRTMHTGALAVHTENANQQHYEVPTEFFKLMLGPRLKYSCGLFESSSADLAQAEQDMLALTTKRAKIEDGMDILELGCGWGSLTLYLAEQFPISRITAVSNSTSQRDYIVSQAEQIGLNNLEVITSDMNDFDTDNRFDRVVSVEMFEHMRNYHLLLERVADWLKTDGQLFFHVFCHRDTPYFFEVESSADWMSKHFFSGGVMPSYDLPTYFQDHLELKQSWFVSGQHYARTCQHWLNNLAAHQSLALAALGQSDNPEPDHIQFNRWRLFTMACEELFAYKGGTEWHVGHFLMAPK